MWNYISLHYIAVTSTWLQICYLNHNNIYVDFDIHKILIEFVLLSLDLKAPIQKTFVKIKNEKMTTFGGILWCGEGDILQHWHIRQF